MPDERLSEKEYLVRERAARYKSEYRQGRMVAMTGASRQHNRITVDLTAVLSTQLRDRPCEVFVSDMRVKVRAAGLYTYPDVVALCGPAEFEDEDTLLNPALIVEVLSPSTESYDREEKFAAYRTLDSLREYVLIAQDRMHVERWVREDDLWHATAREAPDAVLELTSIGCAVPLREIYRRVELGARAAG